MKKLVLVLVIVLVIEPFVSAAPQTLYRDPTTGLIISGTDGTAPLKYRHGQLFSDGLAVDSSLDGKVDKTTTVNTHPLNANVIVTKADVGLGNVDNTSDANKPVSTAQQTALDLKVNANGTILAATKTKITYDTKGLVTSGSDATTVDIADSTDKRYVTDAQRTAIDNAVPITRTVNGHPLSANVTVTKSDVSLGNVDNTSDASKPVSTAQQAALDLKAPLASPPLTGIPTAPTAAVDTNTGQLATAAFVLAQAASATPIVSGTGAAGTSTRYARADHVHPAQTTITGNAGTATALQTGRTINGTTFDGTANITVTAAAGTLTGATLASGVTASSLTSVGTLTSGTWNAGIISGAYLSSSINAQSGTSYTAVDGDRGKLVTLTNASPVAVTLPQAGASSLFISGWFAYFENRGVGMVTITPTTSTIDGGASITLIQNSSIRVFSDGTNYFTMRGKANLPATTLAANNFANAITADGTLSGGQPAFNNISGSVAASQMPALTGDVTTSAGAVATTIATNVVTNAKAAQMAANTVKGNNTGSTANATDLTVSQAQTLLQINSSNKQTTTLGSAAASITFTVPSGYTNLRLIFSGRGSDAATSQPLRLRFATGGGAVDTGANYDGERFLEYTSASSLAVSDTGATYAVLSSITAAGSPASYSESVEVLVNNYAGTTFYKTWLSRAVTRDNTTTSQMMGGGHWKNTGAITSIELSPAAGNFITGTTATLIAE